MEIRCRNAFHRSKPIYDIYIYICDNGIYPYNNIVRERSLSFVGHAVRGGCPPAALDHLNAQLPRHRCAHDGIFQVSLVFRFHAVSRTDVLTAVHAGRKGKYRYYRYLL